MEKQFGVAKDGGQAMLYTLSNDAGVEVRITNYGGIIVGIDTPDRNGKVDDIVLGYDDLGGYINDPNHPYFGALIGRYANRIANGRFTLGGETYQLPINNGPNSLHGGLIGFDRKLWAAKANGGNTLELTLGSPNGDQGYPGNFHAKVIYSLEDENTLRIDYSATADAETIVNLTNHSYFNLAGAGNGDILSTVLSIDADRYTPIDKTLIPTGELHPVDDTPFDFRNPTPIGERIDATDQQIAYAGGYDHNWCLNNASRALTHVATAYHPESGRALEVFTTQPGVQFYSGNFLDGSTIGKGGKPYAYRSGFCLETQHFPDSPNHPYFPSTVLRPGETFHEVTQFRFSVR